MPLNKYTERIETTIWGNTKKSFEEIEGKEDERPATVFRMLLYLGMDEYDKQRGVEPKVKDRKHKSFKDK